MSPAAYTSGTPALRSGPHTTPSRISSPESASHSVAGVTPMPDDHDVGRLVPAAVDQHRAGLEALDRDAAPHLDAVVGVDGGDRGAHRRAEAADQRRRRALEHQHLVAELARRGGDLEADEAGADDDHASAAAGDPLAQVERVVDRSQHDDVGQVVLSGQLAWARTGGEDRALEAHVLAAVELRSGGRRDRARRPRVDESPVDVERRRCRRALRSAIRSTSHSPRQQPLRERRAVVGHVALVADDGDRAVEAGGAQRLDGTQAGERGTDDDDVAHHASIRSTSGPYGSHMVPTEHHRRRDQRGRRASCSRARRATCVELGARLRGRGLRRRPAHGATRWVRVGSDPVRDRRRRALVRHVRRAGADRTDGDDVGAVDAIPATGPGQPASSAAPDSRRSAGAAWSPPPTCGATTGPTRSPPPRRARTPIPLPR